MNEDYYFREDLKDIFDDETIKNIKLLGNFIDINEEPNNNFSFDHELNKIDFEYNNNQDEIESLDNILELALVENNGIVLSKPKVDKNSMTMSITIDLLNKWHNELNSRNIHLESNIINDTES